MRRAGGRGLVAAAALAALVLAAPARGDVVLGGAGVRDSFFPRAGNSGYEAGHYRLRLFYRPRSGRLRARAAIRAYADVGGGNSLGRFNLDYRGPRISSVRVNGAAAGFRRKGPELIVRPDAPIRDGRRFLVKVRYAGRPRQIRDPDGSREGWLRTPDGAVALGEPLGSTTWFPANNHPTDEASYKIIVTTPRRLRAISNGKASSGRRHGRRRTTVWSQRSPMASYLATVAIGRFRIDRGWIRVPYLGAADARLPRTGLGALFERSRRALGFLRTVAGRYPFEATGGVIDPAGVGYALETQTRPYYPGIPSQDLVVHELAHEWFGNSVSLGDWSQIWLNEGLATYMEWLYAERRGGPSAAERFDALYAAHGPGDTGFWNPPPAAIPGPEAMFDRTVYDRGAMALQVLRELSADDEAFFRILREWALDHRDGAVTTQDFRAEVTEEIGGVPALFNQWLTEPGKPAAP